MYFILPISEKADPCSSSPCVNGACTGDSALGTYTCDCTGTGYDGQNCDSGKLKNCYYCVFLSLKHSDSFDSHKTNTTSVHIIEDTHKNQLI